MYSASMCTHHVLPPPCPGGERTQLSVEHEDHAQRWVGHRCLCWDAVLLAL